MAAQFVLLFEALVTDGAGEGSLAVVNALDVNSKPLSPVALIWAQIALMRFLKGPFLL
jgi:hypothetical protein